MTGLEMVCRKLAEAHFRRKFGEEYKENGIKTYDHVNRYWPEFRTEAKQLLESLKGQPPHITDRAPASPARASDIFDVIIAAIVRTGA